MIKTLVLLASSFLASVLSILCVLLLARRFKLYDTIDERKVHTGNIPRLGGIGIFIGFVFGLVFFIFFIGFKSYLADHIWNLICGVSLIFIMGVWDDMRPWRARYKLLVQIAAAIIIISADFTFHRITLGSVGLTWNMGIFSYPITFCWIIGVTNAINLIDGIDGLAGTIACMVTLTFAIFFYMYGNISAFYVCLILASSLGGFLVFNLPFPRAKIFMGDGGSQFLGFILAVLPLMQNGNGLASIALPYAAAVLIIPIFDTFAAIWRRLREKRRIDSPDKQHLHHKLMMLGFSARQSLILLAIFQLIICQLIVTSARIKTAFASILIFSVYMLAILFFTVIHIRKEEVLDKSRLL